MGLIERLRNAERQGRDAAHRRMEKALGTWDDAERRLRRKMRLHPKPPTEPAPDPLPESVQPPVSSSRPVTNQSLPHRASEEDAA